MNKYIFENQNNGYYKSWTVFETEKEISNKIHLENIKNIYNLSGPINMMNDLPYGCHYARVGESFECFKNDCEKLSIEIKRLSDDEKIKPEGFENFQIIKGISGNY